MDVKDIHVLIKVKVYKLLVNPLIVLILFCIDRFSKIYVIYLDKKFLGSEIFTSTSFIFDLLSTYCMKTINLLLLNIYKSILIFI